MPNYNTFSPFLLDYYIVSFGITSFTPLGMGRHAVRRGEQHDVVDVQNERSNHKISFFQNPFTL
ncbi:MAG: hypothetical protein SGJ10_12055 [Bacteroidota bacterium]|nr:hypothetical protein [Bacteroidota bacterium]